MAVQVDTAVSAAATATSVGRKILRTSNGTLWVIVPQASDSIPRLRYSTDDGANWSTSSTAFAEAINGTSDASWVFCSDGAIYLMYQLADGSAVKVRKGTLNGGHTDITWSAATTVNTASGQSNFGLVAHEEGGDTIVHVVYADVSTLCEYRRVVWGAAFSSATTLTTTSGETVPKIDFHHTLADVTAVKDSTPHVYISWRDGGTVMFRKFVYSSGPTWTPNAARTITSDLRGPQGFAMSFDGTSIVMIAESQGTAEALLVLERDAADTTTTSLPNTPTRTGTGVPYTDITYSPERDIEVFHSDAVALRLQRVTYDRSGSSWGSWATIDVDDDDRMPQVKLGYWSGSKADAVEVIWMDQTGTPYPLMHERFAFVAPPSVAVGWGVIPIGG